MKAIAILILLLAIINTASADNGNNYQNNLTATLHDYVISVVAEYMSTYNFNSTVTTVTYQSDSNSNIVRQGDDINAAFQEMNQSRTSMEKTTLIGDFVLTSRIDIPSNTEIELQGSITSYSSNGIFSVPDYGTNIYIHGGKIIGSTVGVTGFSSHHFSNLIISGVTFANQSGHGIYLGAIHNVTYERNIFINEGGRSIFVESGCGDPNTNVHINKNRIYNSSGHAISVSTCSENIIISENFIDKVGAGNGGIWVEQGKNIIIANNIVSNTHTEGIQVTNTYRANIENNEIDNVQSDYGLSVVTSQYTVVDGNIINKSDASGIAIETSDYSTISNNVVIDAVSNPTRSGGVAFGVVVENSRFSSVMGNIVYEKRTTKSMETGIGEYGTSNYNVFSGNIVNGYKTYPYICLGDKSYCEGNISTSTGT